MCGCSALTRLQIAHIFRIIPQYLELLDLRCKCDCSRSYIGMANRVACFKRGARWCALSHFMGANIDGLAPSERDVAGLGQRSVDGRLSLAGSLDFLIKLVSMLLESLTGQNITFAALT